MNISGNKIELKLAQEADRKNIYNWLTQSDLTSCMMGAPDYPDHPVPSWKEFCEDYKLTFFNSLGDGKGRNYIIVFNNEEIGSIGYDLLDKKKNKVVLDIWMSAEKYCGHGHGNDALKTLCSYIHRTYGITNFIISPSARNKRAVAAYRKAGFEYVSTMSKEEQQREFGKNEYDDNVIMIKKLITKQSKTT